MIIWLSIYFLWIDHVHSGVLHFVKKYFYRYKLVYCRGSAFNGATDCSDDRASEVGGVRGDGRNDDNAKELSKVAFSEEEGTCSVHNGAQHDSRSSLFVDGIFGVVSYSQVRDSFSQYGQINRIFVQSHKKPSRRWRFGFVHMHGLC